MRIIVFSDLHANLEALDKFKIAIKKLGKFDKLIFLGDAIGVGPFPKEVIEELMQLDGLVYLRGNHEQNVLDGIDQLKKLFSSIIQKRK